ncbi:uncharacterized protein E0L32_005242 [Thyridium curvatum]|uniref:AA1-like domain-containing protein n=1 Tax=Thyridium curvatum TaxID=1093900 RepID=A0A507BD97_9PEZI|nr:uncharacterized protein E0L32_005242 [Thyridium curvatum]TPX14550.1 hypothetical protein E0L32_005242 [Thyridium curvatum]
MKSFTALTTAILAGLVSAKPLHTRATTEFDVTSFSANTLPHGTAASIGFKIAAAPGGASTECKYSDNTSVGHLPDVPFRPCDDAAFQWQFRQEPSQPGTEGQYLIVVKYDDPTLGHPVAGAHEWPASDFPFENQGSTVSQAYRGEPDFVIQADQ